MVAICINSVTVLLRCGAWTNKSASSSNEIVQYFLYFYSKCFGCKHNAVTYYCVCFAHLFLSIFLSFLIYLFFTFVKWKLFQMQREPDITFDFCLLKLHFKDFHLSAKLHMNTYLYTTKTICIGKDFLKSTECHWKRHEKLDFQFRCNSY